MHLNFKTWLNEEITTAQLTKVVGDLLATNIGQATQTTTRNTNDNSKNVLAAIKDTKNTITTGQSTIKADLKDKTNLLTKILTGSNKTPNPNEKPENTNKKLADTIAQQVMLYIQAKDKAQDRSDAASATTPSAPAKSPVTKPTGV